MATLQEIKTQADKTRAAFMANTIRLDQSQLVRQIETLGECKAEDESRAGQIVTQRCIDFAIAVGRFRFPDTFDNALRVHFQGKE